MDDMVESVCGHFGALDRHFGRAVNASLSRPTPLLALENRARERPTAIRSTRPVVIEPRASGHQRYYAATMSTYSGPGGVAHARRKVYDSTTGKTELAEMRRLGNQAVAVRREIAADGSVKDEVDRKNIDEGEIDTFGQRWNNARSQLPKLVGSGRAALTNRQAEDSPATGAR
jgi:hypothetical protein